MDYERAGKITAWTLVGFALFSFFFGWSGILFFAIVLLILEYFI